MNLNLLDMLLPTQVGQHSISSIRDIPLDENATIMCTKGYFMDVHEEYLMDIQVGGLGIYYRSIVDVFQMSIGYLVLNWK